MVIVRERPARGLVVVEALVRAGPRTEPPDDAGVAALVRSLLPRGTHRRTAQEIAATIEAAGGFLGGSTFPDVTSLYAVVPAVRAQVAFDLVADLLANARFDPEEVESQRRLALARMQQVADQPLQRAVELSNAALYPYHPYGRPLAGTPATVSALARDQLLAFYRTHYTAANAVVTVAGELPAADALAHARRAFGTLPPGTLPPRLRWLRAVERALAPPPVPQQVREVQATAAAWIVAAYLTVPVGHPDFAALRVLNAILGEGAASRLWVEVRERRGLAYQVGSVLAARAGPGFLRLIAGTDPPNLSTVLAILEAEVARLRDAAPAPGEVDLAKRSIAGRTALARQDLEAEAYALGWQELLGLGVDYEARFLAQVARITPDDVHRVARRYLAGGVVAIVAPASAR
ncbi:MAG: pitrilysin family protein [Armatimonadota bacterium]|nr:pitrilysin family protein [Armatimonadota bacterium]